MALPTPSLVDLDDPLQPARRTPEPPSEPSATETPTAGDTQTKPRRRAKQRRGAAQAAVVAPAARQLAEEELVAVFVRVPASISDRLAATITTLNAGRPRRARISQQDLVGALLDRYATTELARDAPELAALVDDYRNRVRG
jgi:hypothetical protein